MPLSKHKKGVNGVARMRWLAVALSLGVLASCTEIIRNHGYSPSEEELLDIIVGVDTRESVEEVIGRPSAAGLLEAGGWYYVGSRKRHFAYRAPEEIDRQVVAIRFDDDGTVENIERFGLERGQVVTLSRRVTDTSVETTSTFVRQLIRNFGRVDVSEALND